MNRVITDERRSSGSARTALLYAAPALLLALAWAQLEDGAGARLLLFVVLALVPGLVRPLILRVLAGLAVALVAFRTAFGGSLLEARPFDSGHDFFGPALDRFRDGVLAFYEVTLPFAAAEQEFMRGVVELTLFGFCLALALAVAARRPLVAGLVLLAGCAWPVTLVSGREPLWGAAILAGALGLLAAGGRRPPRAYAPAALAVGALVVVALAAATSPAVAKGEFLSWQRWDPWDEVAEPVGVRYVWDAHYGGIRFPEKKTVVLTATGPTRSLYWRATTLDDFVEDRWIEELVPVLRSSEPEELLGDSFLPPAARNRAGLIAADIEIRALRDRRLPGPSMPVAYEPQDLGDIVYTTSNVALAAVGLRQGGRYRVLSYAPQPRPQQLERSRPTALRGGTLESAYLEIRPGRPTLPFGVGGREAQVENLFRLSPRSYRPLVEQARTVVGDARNAYGAVVALEAWFRSEGGFVYDEQPPLSGTVPPLVDFVTRTKRGYCQHYAGAMALMLRYLGIPARVAAGFTSGSYDAEERRWTVTDHEAHTWVEVWFNGWGWLPFDPTPGRGRLSGTYTTASNAPDLSAIGDLLDRAQGSVSGSSLGQRPQGLLETFDGRDNPGDLGERGPDPQRGQSLLRLLALLAALVVVAIAAAKITIRKTRYLTRDPRRIANACRRELVDFLRDQRVDVSPSTTLHELGQTVEARLSVDPRAFVRAASAAAYAPALEAPGAAERTRAELRSLRRGLRRRLSVGARVRGLLSLRSLGLGA